MPINNEPNPRVMKQALQTSLTPEQSALFMELIDSINRASNILRTAIEENRTLKKQETIDCLSWLVNGTQERLKEIVETFIKQGHPNPN